MKLKHPTHDPKPMDALSYYLQVQREYGASALFLLLKTITVSMYSLNRIDI